MNEYTAWSLVVSASKALLGKAAGRALLRYVETRAIIGGTTAMQGNPKGAVPPDGELVRNIDSERLAPTRTSSASAPLWPAPPRTLTPTLLRLARATRSSTTFAKAPTKA